MRSSILSAKRWASLNRTLERKMKKNRSAFTLIELLVVIAIIAILAALLLPSLSSSKARAQQISCLARQKQWAIATRMYADDFDDLMPREKCTPNAHTWPDITASTNQNVWFNALPFYMSLSPASAYEPDRDAFHSTGIIFQCPSA